MNSQVVAQQADSPSQSAAPVTENSRWRSSSSRQSLTSGVSQAHRSIGHSPIPRPFTSRGPSFSSASQRHLSNMFASGLVEDRALSKPEDTRPYFQDMRSNISKATMRSQEICQILLKNLQTYHTLQFLLRRSDSYEGGGDKAAGTYPSVGNLAAAYAPMGKFRLASAHEPTPVLKSIDNALDAAALSAVRHNFENHFITAMASIGERSSSVGPFVPPGSQSLRVGDGVPSASLSVSQTGAAGPEATAEAIFISAWARDHPSATPAQVQQRRSEWRRDQADRARLQLRQEVRRLHQELEDQYGMAGASGDEMHPPIPFGLADTAGNATMKVQDTEEVEASWQRGVWERFMEAEPLPSAKKLLPATETTRSELVAPSSCIVKDYAADQSVRDWLAGRGWVHRTHLHEASALRIQQVFRAYLARGNTQRRRVARFLAFQKALKMEEEVKKQWEVSLKIFHQGSGQVQSTRSLNALLFFRNKMSAIISMRRTRNAARAAAEAEIANFAATSIQRVYRGHRARRLVYGMRHPEWLKEVMQQHKNHAALRIQTIWRGYHTRKALRQRHKAAWVIQRAHRFHCARVSLTQLRLKLKKKSMEQVRFFAIQIIVTFLQKCCSKKRDSSHDSAKPIGGAGKEIGQCVEKM